MPKPKKGYNSGYKGGFSGTDETSFRKARKCFDDRVRWGRLFGVVGGERGGVSGGGDGEEDDGLWVYFGEEEGEDGGLELVFGELMESARGRRWWLE